jgi:hypothetical protein
VTTLCPTTAVALAILAYVAALATLLAGLWRL